MSEFSKRIGAPALPSVNLLPKDIAEKRAMRAVQFSALMAIVIAIGVVVVGYLGALGAKGLAERSLDDARNSQDAAIAVRDGKADVYHAYVEREIEEYTLAQIGYGEVDYEQLSTAILATADSDTSFESLRLKLPSAFGLDGVITDPIFGGGIGSLDFQARAVSYEAATELLVRMEQVPGVANAYGTVEPFAQEGDSGVYWQISGQAVITDLRLSDRLLPTDGITGIVGIEVFPGAVGAEEAPSPEPSPVPTPTTEEEN